MMCGSVLIRAPSASFTRGVVLALAMIVNGASTIQAETPDLAALARAVAADPALANSALSDPEEGNSATTQLMPDPDAPGLTLADLAAGTPDDGLSGGSPPVVLGPANPETFFAPGWTFPATADELADLATRVQQTMAAPGATNPAALAVQVCAFLATLDAAAGTLPDCEKAGTN